MVNGEHSSCIQIIDITTNIKIQQLNGEKQTLQLVNATVSHEMRNPLNSIHSHNLKMKDILENLTELIITNAKKIPTEI